ncbi:MAG: Spx/MgsR family transcriptional regulator [Alteromonadaceae bacterium]|jgi:Spx/MgsR family transcriptional regulator
MVTLYGITNCDTVKKSQKWLQEQKIEYTFHDFKKQGLSQELLTAFVKQGDWATLLNKRSTTFRQLPDEVKSNLTDDIMFNAVIDQPTLLKRPLLQFNNQLYLGFKEVQYQAIFKAT